MKDFANKTVFITGGASGIGLETGCQLARLGAHIVVLDFNPTDKAMQVLETARRSQQQRVARYQLDISNREQVIDVVNQAVVEAGVPDLAVNSAGIGLGDEFCNSKFEDFDRVMQVNLYGTRHFCEALVPHMRKRGYGRIVLVASMGGFIAIYGYTNYSTSKFAVRGFAESLRYELKPLGIDVQLLCPGEAETPMVTQEHLNMHPATWEQKKMGGTITVDVVVSDLLNGIRNNSPIIVTGGKSSVAYWIHKFTPARLWYAVNDRFVANGLKKL